MHKKKYNKIIYKILSILIIIFYFIYSNIKLFNGGDWGLKIIL